MPDASLQRVLGLIVALLQAKQEVKRLTERLQARELEAQPGMTMLETFESNVNQVLNKARDDAGTSAQNSLLPTNNVVRMVTAGSKGSFINISQVYVDLLTYRSVHTPVMPESANCDQRHSKSLVLL